MRNILQILEEDDSDEDIPEEGNRQIPFHLFFQILQQQQLLMNDRKNDSHEELLNNLLKYEKEMKEESREYNAFKEIRRDYFVPEKYKKQAFNDSPLDIVELNTNLSSVFIYLFFS